MLNEQCSMLQAQGSMLHVHCLMLFSAIPAFVLLASLAMHLMNHTCTLLLHGSASVPHHWNVDGCKQFPQRDVTVSGGHQAPACTMNGAMVRQFCSCLQL